jgi:hypothetical protein
MGEGTAKMTKMIKMKIVKENRFDLDDPMTTKSPQNLIVKEKMHRSR